MEQNYITFTEAETIIAADSAAVWDCLLNKTGEIFMGANFKTDWQVGQHIEFTGNWQGNAYRDYGVIVVNVERQKLSFTQFSSLSGKEDTPENYDLISFVLTQTDGSTTVRLTMAKPNGVEVPSGEEKAMLTKNLDLILENLKQSLSG
jgi:Activator of Hsp90 ATPase homolog 1-like protein